MELGLPLKSFLALIAGFVAIAASLFWIDDRPTTMTWALRITLTACCLGLVAIILFLHFRDDLVPDYLRMVTPNYFNRDGFAFVPVAGDLDGCCCLTLIFQNQRDRACLGRVRLRPAPGFFLTRSAIADVVFEVFCRPGAFGRVNLPIPLARQYQGTLQSFELGASVEHLEGKGRLVRFHDGQEVEVDDSLKAGKVAKAIKVGLVAVGHAPVWRGTPSKCRILLPKDVAEELPGYGEPETETFFELGQDPLNRASLELLGLMKS